MASITPAERPQNRLQVPAETGSVVLFLDDVGKYDQVPIEARIIEEAGFSAKSASKASSDDELDDWIRSAEAITYSYNKHKGVQRELIERATNCRAFVRYGTSVSPKEIDIDCCTQHGIMVVTQPDYGPGSVVSQALAHLFAISRNTQELSHRISDAQWPPIPSRHSNLDIFGKALGLVGLGTNGQLFARVTAGFGWSKIRCYDPYADPRVAKQLGVELCDTLSAVLTNSDFISLHCPFTEETRHLIDAKRLAEMQPNSVLINTSRGDVVDEAAVRDAVESGHIRYGADVVEVEGGNVAVEDFSSVRALVQGDPFAVSLSPHTGAVSPEAGANIRRMVAEGSVAALRGELPRSIINFEIVKDHPEFDSWVTNAEQNIPSVRWRLVKAGIVANDA